MYLKEYRDSRGMTLKQVAERIGVDQSTVFAYETFSAFPSWQVIVRIEEVTEKLVTFYDFVAGHQEKCKAAG